MTQQSPTRSFLVGATFRGAARAPRSGSALARLALAGLFGGGLLTPFASAKYPQSTPPANYGVPQSYAAPQNYGVPRNYAATQNYTATQNYAATQNAGTNVSADPQLAGQTDEQLAAEARCSCSKVARLPPNESISSCNDAASFAPRHSRKRRRPPSITNRQPASHRTARHSRPRRRPQPRGTKPSPVTRRINGRLRRPSSRPASSRPPSSRINRLRNSRRGTQATPAVEELDTAERKRAAHAGHAAGSQSVDNSQHTDSRQRETFRRSPCSRRRPRRRQAPDTGRARHRK